MSKYIDADKLKYEIERRKLSNRYIDTEGYEAELLEIIDSLQQEQDMDEVSDGYHTFGELYYYRMLYNAAFFNLLPKWCVHKSKRHHTGEECFGGGWFIVMANLPTGQISNHYELKDWDLFQVPEKEIADEWDGHTPQEAAERIHKYLQQEQQEPFSCGHENGSEPKPEVDLEKEFQEYWYLHHYDQRLRRQVVDGHGKAVLKNVARHFYELGLKARKED